jgi:ribose transport system permease protein
MADITRRPESLAGPGGVSAADQAEDHDALPAWSFLLDKLGPFSMLGVLVVLVVAFRIAAPSFLSQQNWIATSLYAVEYLLLGIGETFVIVAGGIDLSVGGTLGFSSMASAVLMAHMIAGGGHQASAFVVGVIVCLVIGAVVGLINGLLITRLNLGSFIVTLGTLGMLSGGINLLNGGTEVVTLPARLGSLGSTVYGGWVPLPVAIAVVLTVVFGLLLSKTRFGLDNYAIGSSETAARRAGINVERHLLVVYMLAGLLAGVAGLLVMARFSDASPLAGANDELNAIAATVIGGASLLGGRGSITGTTIGTAIVSVLVTGLVLSNIQPFWQEVAVGAVLIAAVATDKLRVRAST